MPPGRKRCQAIPAADPHKTPGRALERRVAVLLKTVPCPQAVHAQATSRLIWDESCSWIGLKANRRVCTDRAIISPQLLDLQRRGDIDRVKRHLAYFFFHINDL